MKQEAQRPILDVAERDARGGLAGEGHTAGRSVLGHTLRVRVSEGG